MPKKAKELTNLEIKKIKNEGVHAVGGVTGLYLRIIGNSRAWVFRAKISGKSHNMGLGNCDDVPLVEAREKAYELRKQIRNGINPIQERRAMKARARLEAAKTKTFRECAETYITTHRTGWSVYYAQQWDRSLGNYAYPIIGGLSVADVDTGLVMQVMQQPVNSKKGEASFWNAKTVTADRLRNQIENILDWAKTSGLREGDNPARWAGHLEHKLPSLTKVHKVQHFPALPYTEIGFFMTDLRKREGMPARALEFSILTVSRPGEVCGATWDELDMAARVWIIPAERMKARKEHRVPLSDAVMKILEFLPRYENIDYVFPSTKGGKMLVTTLTDALRRTGRGDVTVHGFRSTFRDWAGETTSYPREVIEHALAHKLKDKVEAAYQRGTLFDKRRGLMTDWSRYCAVQTAKGDNVVFIQNRKAG